MVTRSIKKLFVEGGGDNNEALRSECRRGFNKLLEKAGFKGRMPRIVPCGGRSSAYDQFCTALENGETVAILLLDAEGPMTTDSPWEHVKKRQGDGWDKPEGAQDSHLHFMTECMESWFLADKEALSRFFGKGFNTKALPANTQVEQISKLDVFKGLTNATKNTKKGVYGKGPHSFKILAEIDPARVRSHAPFAKRLMAHLDKVL